MSRLLDAMSASGSYAPPPAIVKKKRGGRQLRNVILSSELKFCIRQFATQVGMPRLMEPTGFRDFRGWLERIGGPSASEAWAGLVQAMVEEGAGDVQRILFMKEEVVREIVRTIVVPRPGESAKLVSTNCGRQCARPRSGNTLMTILERVLVERGVCTMEEVENFMRERGRGRESVLGLGNMALGGSMGSVAMGGGSMSLSSGSLSVGGTGHSVGSMGISLGSSSNFGGAPSLGMSAGSGGSGVSTTSSAVYTGESSGHDRLPSFQELQDSLEGKR